MDMEEMDAFGGRRRLMAGEAGVTETGEEGGIGGGRRPLMAGDAEVMEAGEEEDIGSGRRRLMAGEAGEAGVTEAAEEEMGPLDGRRRLMAGLPSTHIISVERVCMNNFVKAGIVKKPKV
jgi:hypothetical protein